MRTKLRIEAVQWAIIGAMFVLAAVVWPAAPDRIPVHWGLSGEPDRYGGKIEGLLLLPLATLGVYLAMLLLPRVDPKRANYAQFGGAYTVLRLSMVAFLATWQNLRRSPPSNHDRRWTSRTTWGADWITRDVRNPEITSARCAVVTPTFEMSRRHVPRSAVIDLPRSDPSRGWLSREQRCARDTQRTSAPAVHFRPSMVQRATTTRGRPELSASLYSAHS